MPLPRYELRLTPERKAELEAIAGECGTTVAELLRIGAGWIVANKEFLTRGKPPTGVEKAAA